ncbi:hypothetical protein L202_02317 [Cryptococcus amylolentus CBS 6039]|uniref:Uncharacterized protein n=2 Tax=Cryptococcus amylolentus TaxID=104669 RepID=A0A1E3I0G0_9TREE|nr:hypothetical protein L202_02317 [Cryptococcus amylolentus CBS 6039]ODN81988.1 hypothetical protein L202_02317 [Cryptococcus amylolentus CBS 6039]ODO09878.1 hypothetical protein I350_02100 [Cryptococcus amylolentus CBS 6273]
MSNSQKREKLDIESPEEREARLGQLLSSISTGTKSSDTEPSTPSNPLPSRPHAMPESDVLARVRAFLPQFQAANEDLLKRAKEDPDSVDIEKGQGQHIAMDLGLGVFDAPENPSSDMGPIIESTVPEGFQQRQDEESEDESSSDSDSEGTSSSSESGESVSAAK